MKDSELFTKEVYEAAQAYRHAPCVYQDEVARKYREMVLLIARTARKVDDKTPKEQTNMELIKQQNKLYFDTLMAKLNAIELILGTKEVSPQ